MGQTLADDIDAMLASVEKEVSDSDLVFKLRTARQLIVVYDDLLQQHQQSIDTDDIDDESLENLRQLGYLE